MTNKSEDSLAFKTFLYCPLPGVDLLAGATVFAATSAAEACGDALKDAVKEGIREVVSDGLQEIVTAGKHAGRANAVKEGLDRPLDDALREGLIMARGLGESVVERQLEPIASGLASIASAINSLATKDADASLNAACSNPDL